MHSIVTNTCRRHRRAWAGSRLVHLQDFLDRLIGRWRLPPPRAPRVVVLSADARQRECLENRCRSAADVLIPDVVTPDAVPGLSEEVDVAIVDLGGFTVDPTWLIDTLRARHPGVRLVVCGDDITYFDEVFDAGADAWVPRQAESVALAVAMTGDLRRRGITAR